ncbi:MAG TPA: hypothetical protein VL442_23740 [Mucilaginibacter sp.]|nr:hypothetical protein [Mucilaginibacter sp.]
MEVHHHPEVEKKGFKEYLLEGLMIFLAVMMGFIAENIRENISEHKRAAEFARSYYGDIKKDTALLHQALRFSAHKIAAIDSIETVMRKPSAERNDTVIVTKGIVASAVLPFEPSTENYEQIKSSGIIRSFKQRMVILMNEYDLQAKHVVRREDITQKFITEQMVPFIMTTGDLGGSYDIMTGAKITHKIHLEWDPPMAKKYLNIAIFVKILTLRSMQEYRKQLVVADKVLKELEKEYDVREE